MSSVLKLTNYIYIYIYITRFSITVGALWYIHYYNLIISPFIIGQSHSLSLSNYLIFIAIVHTYLFEVTWYSSTFPEEQSVSKHLRNMLIYFGEKGFFSFSPGRSLLSSSNFSTRDELTGLVLNIQLTLLSLRNSLRC